MSGDLFVRRGTTGDLFGRRGGSGDPFGRRSAPGDLLGQHGASVDLFATTGRSSSRHSTPCTLSTIWLITKVMTFACSASAAVLKSQIRMTPMAHLYAHVPPMPPPVPMPVPMSRMRLSISGMRLLGPWGRHRSHRGSTPSLGRSSRSSRLSARSRAPSLDVPSRWGGFGQRRRPPGRSSH